MDQSRDSSFFSCESELEFSDHSDAPRNDEQEDEKIAVKEGLMVTQARILVSIIFTSVAVAVIIIANVSLKTAQKKSFINQFEELSNEATESVIVNIEQLYSSLESLAYLASSTVEEKNLTWPFVTIPYFERLAKGSLEFLGIEMIVLVPIVFPEDREAWGNYSVLMQSYISGNDDLLDSNEEIIKGWIHPELDDSITEQLPLWQTSPAPYNYDMVNYDISVHPSFKGLLDVMTFTRYPAFFGTSSIADALSGTSSNGFTQDEPIAVVMHPVYDSFEKGSEIVGLIVAFQPLKSIFQRIIRQTDSASNAIEVVLISEGLNDEVMTFRVEGHNSTFIGKGDLHDKSFDKSFTPAPKELPNHKSIPEHVHKSMENLHCDYKVMLYPSIGMRQNAFTAEPKIYTMAITTLFVVTGVFFLLYDRLAEKRQLRVASTALQAGRIVTSLFPGNSAKLLYAQEEEKRKIAADGSGREMLLDVPKNRLRSFLSSSSAAAEDVEVLSDSKPIADLFPETTVMYADIAGFTAWSSVREPTQVFTLLETLYRAYDLLAKQRGVFKVETIGDCYVAVCGLPQPRKDHAVVMAKFAQECLNQTEILTSQLEVALGPDTGDLDMRIGLHSGPVTAGVLRGERARFQLFGDTVNTAARIEATGERRKVHISSETAELLKNAGKGHWCIPREEPVTAKGNGELWTFWLFSRKNTNTTVTDDETLQSEPTQSNRPSILKPKGGDMSFVSTRNLDSSAEDRRLLKIQRLIGWNCELLQQLLKQIVARQQARKGKTSRKRNATTSQRPNPFETGNVIGEIKEVINLPEFESESTFTEQDVRAVELSPLVLSQLRSYVTLIASMYRDNPFHNFEHASHVAMSVSKLLARIVAPDLSHTNFDEAGAPLQQLHDHTYGITSDPLTQFSVVFSALIHDVDHRGIPNPLLLREDPDLVSLYKNRSVAEQNSVDLAWELLMDDQFKNLRGVIYSSEDELSRFRQLIVNSVMATDIFEPELAKQRKQRWLNAFQEESYQSKAIEESLSLRINRKATIVIEHIIQASDVSHTMQHWHVYQKWNEHLFEEMYASYISKRSDKNPVDGWYKGEMWFYDNYVIPLAKKLKECGVFGVSSDEYLNYALANRQEWELKGNSVVQEFVDKCTEKYGVLNEDGKVSSKPGESGGESKQMDAIVETEDDIADVTEKDEVAGETEQVEAAGETKQVEVASETEQVDVAGETERVDSAGETERVDSAGETEEVGSAGETEEVDAVIGTEEVDAVIGTEEVNAVIGTEEVNAIIGTEEVDPATDTKEIESAGETTIADPLFGTRLPLEEKNHTEGVSTPKLASASDGSYDTACDDIGNFFTSVETFHRNAEMEISRRSSDMDISRRLSDMDISNKSFMGRSGRSDLEELSL